MHGATTTYEANRNVIDILENKVGMTSISKYDYTVNSLGQRTARANTGTAFGATSTDDFTYNAKGEITGTTNATIPAYDRTFAYDDIGNRTSATDNIGTTSYTANTLNAYTAIGAASPTHDADGNQTATGNRAEGVRALFVDFCLMMDGWRINATCHGQKAANSISGGDASRDQSR